MILKRSLSIVLTCVCLAGADTTTPELPVAPTPAGKSLWEAGIVGGIGYVPDYPAADESRLKWVAAPYVLYRGKIMRADRDGARARLLGGRIYEMEMSVAASFASKSEDNDAREGMPDIDYLLEIGPRLSFNLWNREGEGRVRLFVPVRAVFSTDLGDFQHRGWTLTPSINGRWNIGRKSERYFITQLAVNFGNRQLNAYFYDVAPQFALPDRPFYDARGGYIGSDLFAGVLLPLGKRLRFFTGAQGLVHSGSANQTSPLFKHDFNYSLAAGVVWVFYRSPKPAHYID